VMSIAVEHERFILTANQLREDILLEDSNRCKHLALTLLGGNF